MLADERARKKDYLIVLEALEPEAEIIVAGCFALGVAWGYLRGAGASARISAIRVRARSAHTTLPFRSWRSSVHHTVPNRRTRAMKNSPFPAGSEERMKGLEPSTFCMASRRSSQLSYIREATDYSPPFRALSAAWTHSTVELKPRSD
jgi:hypothetical protein